MAVIDSRGFNLVVDGGQFNSGIGNIINQVIADKLQKKALGGDQNALASLAGRSSNQARAVGGILVDQQQQAALAQQQAEKQKTMQQEMLGRLARGFSTAADKRGFLAAAVSQLRAAGMEDLAMQAQEDLDAYATNPAAVEAEYGAALQMFGSQTPDSTPASVRELEYLTQGMSAEDVNKARRIQAGLEAPARAFAVDTMDVGGVKYNRDRATGELSAPVINGQQVDANVVAGNKATIKGAETTAAETAKDDVARTAANREKTAALQAYEATVKGINDAFGNAETGPIAGMLPAMTQNQRKLDGAITAMAPVLKQIFRTAGEGTFTDKDQEMLMAMLPTRKDEPGVAQFKLQNIDSIVRAKLQGGTPSAPASVDDELKALEAELFGR